MKHKVAELEGALLDAAVALAEGHALRPLAEPGRQPFWLAKGSGMAPWFAIDAYSSDWRAAGPIIERERIAVAELAEIDEQGCVHVAFFAFLQGRRTPLYIDERPYSADARGPTYLIAAMRARVASKFGDEIELPA